MGHTLFHTGEFVEAKAHFDKGLALYNAAEHRPLAARFWADSQIVILCWRSLGRVLINAPHPLSAIGGARADIAATLPFVAE